MEPQPELHTQVLLHNLEQKLEQAVQLNGKQLLEELYQECGFRADHIEK